MDAQELRNLQEAYLDVYDEGYKLFPYRKVETKQKQIATDYDSLGKKPLTGKSESEISDTLNNLKRLSNRESTLGFRSRMHHPDDVRAKENKNKRKYQLSSGETTAQRARRDPEFRTRMIKDRMKTMSKEGYDSILSYLINEGYADTQEAALAIMGNMSEDWRESIAENVTSGKSRVRNVQPKPTGPISNSDGQSIIQSRIDAENIRIKQAGNAAHAAATSKGLSFSDAEARRKAAELRSKREIAKSYP